MVHIYTVNTTVYDVGMMQKDHHRRSTFGWSIALRTVGWAITPIWVAPALYYNLDWVTPGAGWENLWQSVLVAFAALCFIGLEKLEAWPSKAAAGVLGTILVVNNCWSALDNISTSADLRIDGRKAEMALSSTQRSGRSAWSKKVDEARKTVGDTATDKLESDMQQLLSENSRKWQATKQCDPMEISRSREFCTEYRRLEGLVKTAKVRDEYQAKIDTQDAKLESVAPPPTNADPMAATVADTFGVRPEAVRHVRSLWKTFAIEAAAAIMPMVWIGLIDLLIAGIAMVQRAQATKARVAGLAAKREAAAAAQPKAPAKPVEPKSTPDFDRFSADELDSGDVTWSILATPAFKLWEDWCRARNLPACSQRRFGEMMGERFKRDRNNGYPRYLGVRQRPKGPKLAIVNNPS
jgi:hypothetical protein